MKLNPEILEAIRKAVDYYGNTSQFAKKIGVAHSTVLFWLSGKTANINGTIWEKRVRRVLRDFMNPKPSSASADPYPNELQDPRSPYNSALPSAAETQGKISLRLIPAINFSRMIDFDNTMQSPVNFIRKCSQEMIPFANLCSNCSFGIILDKAEYWPSLPQGARLLISGCDYAENGDIVIGKLRSKPALFCCRCFRTENVTRLEPLNPKLPAMEWPDSENAEKMFWIFPVKEISINLSDACWTGNTLSKRSASV